MSAAERTTGDGSAMFFPLIAAGIYIGGGVLLLIVIVLVCTAWTAFVAWGAVTLLKLFGS